MLSNNYAAFIKNNNHSIQCTTQWLSLPIICSLNHKMMMFASAITQQKLHCIITMFMWMHQHQHQDTFNQCKNIPVHLLRSPHPFHSYHCLRKKANIPVQAWCVPLRHIEDDEECVHLSANHAPTQHKHQASGVNATAGTSPKWANICKRSE